MNESIARAIGGTVFLLALFAGMQPAAAQTYPTKPVRIVVGFPPGGTQDIVARLVSQSLSDLMGQQFVVDNRPGATSNIAAELVVNAPKDGYTLFVAGLANAVSASLYSKLNFNLKTKLQISLHKPIKLKKGFSLAELNSPASCSSVTSTKMNKAYRPINKRIKPSNKPLAKC